MEINWILDKEKYLYSCAINVLIYFIQGNYVLMSKSVYTYHPVVSMIFSWDAVSAYCQITVNAVSVQIISYDVSSTSHKESPFQK